MLVCIGESALLPLVRESPYFSFFSNVYFKHQLSNGATENYDCLIYYDFFFFFFWYSEAEKAFENG